MVERCHAALFTATEYCTVCPSKRWLVSVSIPRLPLFHREAGFEELNNVKNSCVVKFFLVETYLFIYVFCSGFVYE